MMPMRDGVRLATDIYFPPGGPAERRFPVLLERTPYDKRGTSRAEKSLALPEPLTRPEVAAQFAGHGYAVVMQDCRGRYRSEGAFSKYVGEAEDGYDTIEWLVRQPWCDGHIGTMGLSYGAHTQLALACLAPAGLACMFLDSGGFSSAFHGGVRRGGAFEMKQATWAFRHALLSPATLADPARRAALEQVDLAAWFREMPWRPGHSPLAAAPEFESYLFEQWNNGRFDAYWRQPGLYAAGYYGRIPDIPVAIVGSWYDPYAGACLSNYLGLARGHRSPTCLLMGPWTHGNRSVTWAGDVDFGPGSTLDGNIAADYLSYRLAWFDRWLKDVETANPAPRAGVTWFQMGGGSGARDTNGRLQHGGRWRHCDRWPPPGSGPLRLYFSADGGLKSEAPAGANKFREYLYDPCDPLPTIGGALTSGEPIMEGGAFDQRLVEGVFRYRADAPDGPLADRVDVLVFQTAPLDQDLVITGSVVAELWVTSDCPDTDFTIRLIDVYPPSDDFPEGFTMNITDGILRARHRDGWDREVEMTPGEVYRLEVTALPTSNLFRAGHRLRVDISSSSYPQFDINPNIGLHMEPGGMESRIAHNRVYCDRLHPSNVCLAVLQDDGRYPA